MREEIKEFLAPSRRRLVQAGYSSKDHIPIQDHGRIDFPLHGQMLVHHRVAEDAADVAFHHAAEAVIARAHVHADVVDLVLERLQMIAAVGLAFEHGLELAPVGNALGVRRDARELVALARPDELDADAVERIVRKVFFADLVAAQDGLEELLPARCEVRDHHLPAAPELPDRLGEDHRAVHDLSVVHVMGRLELRQQGALPVQKIQRFAELPGPERVVQARADGEAQFAESPEARTPFLEEGLLPFIGIKGHEQIHGPVEHGQDAGVVRGVLVAQHDEVFHGRAQVAVIEIMHRERGKGPDAERGLGDDAELAVAEQHAVEPPGVLVLGAFQDLAGGRDDLDRQGLVRAAAQGAGS